MELLCFNLSLTSPLMVSLTERNILKTCLLLLDIVGVVIGVVSHGGLLLSSNQLSSGDLMAFLVATQTIQRYQLLYDFSLCHSQFISEHVLLSNQLCVCSCICTH